MFRPQAENYVDMMARLFRAENPGGSMAKTVTIQVTDDCNLRCSYCYQINKQHHKLLLEAGERFLDALLDGEYDSYCDYASADAIILEFIGGEPFLEINLIDKLTDYFIQGLIDRRHRWLNRFRISICSNGTLYFRDKVQDYIRSHANHLSFSVSIDGNKQLHDACRVFPDGSGSYDVAMKAVNHYRDTYGVVMGSKMTIAPGNVEYVADAVISLIEHGYVDINLNCVYEKGWTAEHAKILYQQLKRLGDYLLENGLDETVSVSMFDQSLFHPKREDDLQNWCGGTGLMLAVDWKGDLYPCIRYMESSLGDIAKPLIIGNVWDGILQSHEQKCICECLDCINRRTQSTDECFYCPVAEGCSWCSAYNYQEFGTADHRATYICIMHKARALANAYYWNKALRIREPGSGRRFKIWLPEEDALKIISEDEWKLLKFLESGRELNGTADQENHGA